jgi:cytochrome c556
MRRIAFVSGMLAFGLTLAGTGLGAQGNVPSDLDATMKKVGPAFAALRKSIEAMDAKMAQENTAILRTSFADAERFFESKGKHDAHQWANDAGKLVASINTAAAGSKWDDVKASAGNLGKICQTCHTAYREKAEDGTYRMKPGE